MQQMDIVDVFKEKDDFAIVQQQIVLLKPSRSIHTDSVEVRMSNKFIEVECTDQCHELFYQKEDAIAFICKTLEDGIKENKKSIRVPSNENERIGNILPKYPEIRYNGVTKVMCHCTQRRQSQNNRVASFR